MNEITPIDWERLTAGLRGHELGDAVQQIAKACVDKVNEIVKAYNESIKS